ncbi:MAG: TonB-dependent receptor, partial [Bacteroidetes bacterium]|nr:TonB-dependent receptor [Bacteroidota bacterium]
IPFYRSSLGRNFEIELLNKYVGKQYLDNTSNTARMLSAYNTNDVRLRYHLKMKRVGETSLFVTLNNVFNQRYESNGYSYSFISGGSLSTQNYMFPQAGMNWLAGFSVKFQ